jgi:hypothetical protein
MSDISQFSKSLTPEQGFKAMFEFLKSYWQRGQSDELAMLLGAMAIQPDGHPADPALWQDWLASCEKVE